jgi:signal transduction histidine kinase
MRPRISLPALTIRTRLTIVYALTFALGGLIVVAISFYLVGRTTALPDAKAGQVVNGPGLKQTCNDVKSGDVTSELALKCQKSFQEGINVGAKAQRDTTLENLPIYALITLSAVTVLATAAGWVLAGRALRPLAAITEAARAASHANLSHRLALAGPRDELRLLADTFDEMLARLDASFESQRSFIANAGHELRTPLSLVRASVDVVLAKPAPTTSELRSLGDDVRDGVDRAEAILEALLTLARNEHGLSASEPLDLATVTQDVLESIDAGSVQIVPSLQPSPIRGDSILIERLLTNLLDNAVRYNHPNGQVWVTSSNTDDLIRLAVVNTGPIIPGDVAGTLFEPFRRLNERTTLAGLGLGLTLVASIVRAHHGSVAASSRPGGGLEVVATFPTAPAAPSQGEPERNLTGSR